MPRTSCLSSPAELVVFLYFAVLRVICPDASRSPASLCLGTEVVPRLSVPLHSPLSLLSCSSLHHSLRLPLALFLCLSFSSVPTSISNCVSLAFPYLHCVSSRWLTLRAVPVSASPVTLCRSLYALFYLDRRFVRPAYLPRGPLPSLSFYVKLLEFFPV